MMGACCNSRSSQPAVALPQAEWPEGEHYEDLAKAPSGQGPGGVFPCAWHIGTIPAAGWGRGASGNFGPSKQLAGRVFSVICQVHTKIFVAVKTVPILDAFRLRGGAQERATRPPHGLCGDWPSRRREV